MNAEDRRTARNTLLAVPIGLVGGAIAGELIGIGSFVAYVISGGISLPADTTFSSTLVSVLSGSLVFAFVGAVLGMLAFPIAYAAVARTHNVLVVVPAALLATILSYCIGAAVLESIAALFQIPDWREPSWLAPALVFVFPIASMFWACAWAAAKERRRISA